MECTVMSNINFDNPWLLLIAVPLLVLFTVPFAIAIRKDNRNGHNITSQILHILLALIIGLAAAGTTMTSVLTETHVYVVADVSYSAHKNLDTIDNIIKNQLILPKNSKVGVITFGKDYELLCDLGDQSKVKSVKQSTVDDSETNIAPALEYAGTLFSEDVIKRVVLITDGKQTDEVDTYATRRAVDLLETLGVKVDAYYLDNNLKGDVPEVQISSVEFTRSAFISHKEVANVFVQTNCRTPALVEIYRNGDHVDTQAVDLTIGQNTVSVPLYTEEGGTYDYELHIIAEDDTSEYNNTYSFTQTVSNDLNILIITGDWADFKELIAQYGGEHATIDVYENSGELLSSKAQVYSQYTNNEKINLFCFNPAISSSNAFGIPVRDIPTTVEELCKYDEIILADVNLSTLSYSETLVESIDTVVDKFGKSLVTFGNTYIQDVSSPALKSLGEMLPVRFGSDGDKKLYTIIIDTSTSMFSPSSKGDVAKEVAQMLVGTMTDADSVCIVSFNGEAVTIQDPIAVANPEEIMAKIRALKLQQGTRIDAGLRTAYEKIRVLNSFGDKQVMLITDGADTASGAANLQNLVAEMYSDGIVTSVFYVYANQTDTPNNSLLQSLQQAGHGKYFSYNTLSNEHMDDVTFGEMAQEMGDKKVEEDTKVKLKRLTDNVLAGMPQEIPNVSGYWVSIPQASATTVLEVEHKKDVAGNTRTVELPLYSYWNYGNGKVSSFTGGFTGNWIKYWQEQNINGTFFDNVLDTNIPKLKTDYPYTFNVVQDGSFTQVQLIPAVRHFNSTAVVKMTLPNGQVINNTMTFDSGTEIYYEDFNTAAVGKYEVEVTYSYNGEDHKAVSIFNVSYASEYDEFAGFEASPLFRAINGRGQVVLNGTLLLENNELEIGTYVVDFTLPLLIIAVSLYVVDIIIRKLKWEDIKSFFGGFKKKKQEGKK